jgi:hypothetical protein
MYSNEPIVARTRKIYFSSRIEQLTNLRTRRISKCRCLRRTLTTRLVIIYFAVIFVNFVYFIINILFLFYNLAQYSILFTHLYIYNINI